MVCDLHAHSIYSDGTYTPEELISEAEKKGIGALALTDHNTVSGLPRFLRAAKGSTVIPVPGIEISSDYGEHELHIVGLFVRENVYERVEAYASQPNARKEKSNRLLAARLNEAGYCVDYEAMKEQSHGGRINRAHFAKALTDRGYTPSVKAAFATLLAPEAGFYLPPKRLPSLEVIGFLRSCQVLPILAHGFLNMNYDELREFLPQAKEAGLVAMETCYPLFDEATTAKAHALAKEFGLLCSGGSDFHGANKPTLSLGTGEGDLAVPFDYYLRLEEASHTL